MRPYRVLAVYKPSRWNARQIGCELTELTHNHGFKPHVDHSHGPLILTGKAWSSVPLHAEVRRRTFKTAQAESFHWDGDLDPKANPNCLIVLWASNTPTEIKWRHEATIYQARPYEVIVFDNTRCLHRRPLNAPRIRWVFRQRVVPEKGEL